jgi:hypothetical protein
MAAEAEIQAAIIASTDALIQGGSLEEIERILSVIERYATVETTKACIGGLMTTLTQISEETTVSPGTWRRAMALEGKTFEGSEYAARSMRPMSMQASRLTAILQTATEASSDVKPNRAGFPGAQH